MSSAPPLRKTLRGISHKGSFSKAAEPGPWPYPVSAASTPPAAAEATAMTRPQRIDFHQRDVPRPIDVRGNRSPRRMMNNKVIALTQSSVSFQIAAVKVRVGQKYDTAWRTSNITSSDRKSPTHVAREIPLATADPSVRRKDCAPILSVSIDFH